MGAAFMNDQEGSVRPLFVLSCSKSKMNLKIFEGLPSVRNRVKVSI